mgnify:FL=1
MLKLTLFFLFLSLSPPKPVYKTGWSRLDKFMQRQHRKHEKKQDKKIIIKRDKYERKIRRIPAQQSPSR